MSKGRLYFLLALFIFLFCHKGETSAVQASKVVWNTEVAAATVERLSKQLAGARGQKRAELLIRRGEAYSTSGQYTEARSDFGSAIDLCRAGKPSILETTALLGLGQTFYLQRYLGRAEVVLRKAFENARTLNQPILAADGANRLGNVLFAQGLRDEAVLFYRIALDFVVWADDPGIEAGIRCNMARLIREDAQARRQLRTALGAAEKVAAGSERAGLLISIAAEAQKRGGDWITFCSRLLQEALSLSEKAGDIRLHSQAAGRLGALYEHQGSLADARNMTNKALYEAGNLQAHDLLLLWEWQSGRIARIAGNEKEAVKAFQRAVYHIEAIRPDIPILYADGRSCFQEILAPIYYGLADMLLQQASCEKTESETQNLLRRARDTVERIKRSELQDYFRDPCFAAHSQKIEYLAPATAVIYPIILPDRLELLVDVRGRLHRKTFRVPREKLERTAAMFAYSLRNRFSCKRRAHDLHTWLLRPVESILEEHNVDTIVYVPDGALRLLPIAALWDGKKFVVERYAVVTVPGMTLLESKTQARGDTNAMIAGLSSPGPVIHELPPNLLNALRQNPVHQCKELIRGFPVSAEQLRTPSAPPHILGDQKLNPKQFDSLEQIRQTLALPGVAEEIDLLSKELQGRVLLNEDFQLERFSENFTDQSFNIIHIASHGYFGGSPEQNFIMTYDRLLNMNQLQSLIKPKQLAARPVELLTLSACQTAEGDDRSPLGLTGIALSSGARSALGSLWPVSDQATLELLPAFYGHLKEPGRTKAKALQKAQLKLMEKADFQHPFYWSAFILVGNWL